MGISGLLPTLLSITNRHAHLRNFKGQTVAIDSYVWLHKGLHGHATSIIRKGQLEPMVNFCLSRIKQIESFDIKVVMVFDGATLPIKKCTEESRHIRRKRYRVEGDFFFLKINWRKQNKHTHRP